MGLLTDPSAAMYIAGLIWFCLLAHNSVSIQTNFSENALLPGLVDSEFNEGNLAKSYHEELLEEMKTYQDSIPYPWLMAKFRQIGLDTYYHNFTLNYPLGKTQKFTGKNIYGILRAARAASTESVILSIPFRPPSSVHPSTTASVALMLAFAKFANRAQYWAKDIIFLVTEHEQLGVQAWLEAYHSTSCGSKGVLDHGDLRGRSGSIQAAINLELHDINIGYIDVKIEGLNGNLPNLDLVNLVYYMCIQEEVYYKFKGRADFYLKDPFKKWKHSFTTMLSMISTQSTGVPNGNHGLFHRFGIEAVTIQGFNETYKRGARFGLKTLGRILERLFRSLNNLLERFHQSYFFYLLPASDRFVSIGLYIPIIMLLAGTLFVKPCAQWHQMNINSVKENGYKHNRVMQFVQDKYEKTENEQLEEKEHEENMSLAKIGIIFLVTHVIGISTMNSPQFLTKIGLQYEYTTDVFIYLSFILISLILLFLPIVMPAKNSLKNMKVLNILASLELGTMLIAIGMMNFSLAVICGFLYVPIVLFISPECGRIKKYILKFLWILSQPFVVMTLIVTVNTYFVFPNDSLKTIMYQSVTASEQALMFSIVDSLVYGNWMYNVVTAIFLPNWLCFWIVLSASGEKHTVDNKKKIN